MHPVAATGDGAALSVAIVASFGLLISLRDPEPELDPGPEPEPELAGGGAGAGFEHATTLSNTVFHMRAQYTTS
jgi:hypothetical protein